MAFATLTHDRLRDLLHYDPETGFFTWIKSRRGRGRVGSIAGTLDSYGRIRIVIDRREYTAHRLAWFWMKGHWPETDIDHRDCNPANNRWDNLRPTTQSLNNCNTRRRSDNTTGFKGVARHQGGFRARIKLHGKQMDLGVFETSELAHAAYCRASHELHGEFGRTA